MLSRKNLKEIFAASKQKGPKIDNPYEERHSMRSNSWTRNWQREWMAAQKGQKQ